MGVLLYLQTNSCAYSSIILKLVLNAEIIGMCHFTWPGNQPFWFALCLKKSDCSGGVYLFTSVFGGGAFIFMTAMGSIVF